VLLTSTDPRRTASIPRSKKWCSIVVPARGECFHHKGGRRQKTGVPVFAVQRNRRLLTIRDFASVTASRIRNPLCRSNNMSARSLRALGCPVRSQLSLYLSHAASIATVCSRVNGMVRGLSDCRISLSPKKKRRPRAGPLAGEISYFALQGPVLVRVLHQRIHGPRSHDRLYRNGVRRDVDDRAHPVVGESRARFGIHVAEADAARRCCPGLRGAQAWPLIRTAPSRLSHPTLPSCRSSATTSPCGPKSPPAAPPPRAPPASRCRGWTR
jgi:hypothetical protein